MATTFDRFIKNDDDLTFDRMLQKIKEMIQKLPRPMGQIVKFDVLVGLRPVEMVESVRLINDKEGIPNILESSKDGFGAL
jgi:hypothetical protein